MTATILLKELKTFTEAHTGDLILPVRDDETGVGRAAEICLMRLPEGGKDTKASSVKKAPYILLQFINGADAQQAGADPEADCVVRMVICVYCADSSEGSMHVLNIIDRLRIALLKQRVIGSQFTLKLPLEYLVYPDDTAPYFMGEMVTTWEMPTIEREVHTPWL